MNSNKKVSPKVVQSIIGMAGLAFCGILVETSMNVTFPTLIKVFHQPLNNIQWITTAYLLAVTLTIVLAAYLQRSFKFRTLILSSTIASTLGGIICIIASNLPIMLLGRVIQGIGTGIAMPLLFSIIMLEVPREKQGAFIGSAGMIVALAPSLGPTYGGACLSALSWHFNFIFTLPLIIIFGLIAFFAVSDNKTKRDSFRINEYIAIVIAFIALTLAVSNLNSGFTHPIVWGGLLIAIIAFAIFFKLADQKGNSHILNTLILKNSGFALGLSLYVLLQFVQMSLTFVIPNLAQLGLKSSALVSGILLLLGSLISAFLSPVMGRMLDSHGFQKIFLGASILAMLSLLLFTIFSKHLNTTLIVIFHVLYMIGFSMMFNNSMTIGLQQLKVNQIADGNAMFNMLQQYSGSIGTAAMSVIIAIGGSTYSGEAMQTVMGSRLAFIILFIFTVLIFICVLSLIKRSKNGNLK